MKSLLLLLPVTLLACTSPEPTPTKTRDSAPTDDVPTDSDTPTDTSSETTTETDDPGDPPYGPENAWYHAPDTSEVPTEPAGAAWRAGDLPPNLRLTDQNGDEVWLYQFYGRPVFIDWSAEWCGPCQDAAPYMDRLYQEHIDEAVVLTVLLQDRDFARGDAAAVERWVSGLGVTSPTAWFDASQQTRVLDVDAYPTISLLDPELRLAHPNVYDLYEDAYLDQLMDRFALAIGGNLDNAAEVCGNGYDDDMDLVADCMDTECADDPACPDSEAAGGLTPCTPQATDEDTTVDVWRVEVRGAVAAVEADTVSTATAFEPLLYLNAEGADWAGARILGDDEWDCTYPVEEFGCARGWIRPGTWLLLVQPGTGGEEYDGDCVDPALGEYALRVEGDVTLELIHDNVRRGDL